MNRPVMAGDFMHPFGRDCPDCGCCGFLHPGTPECGPPAASGHCVGKNGTCRCTRQATS